VPGLKKEYSYTSTPPLGLLGLFQGGLYLYLYLYLLKREVFRSLTLFPEYI
jgi:hypothetical protein